MLQWIVGNIWTIIICAVLIGIVAVIIISMVSKKRKGKSVICSCGNCKSCAMNGSCHKQ
ncbi:FeoB-associated Cys-rich membrane protein [Ruminococcus sp.]|uniref:FeoB-associated Cys-rich membrane protein n=1 Tax=Ruminococcus sp. TaxID=41978 RepID=UPI002E78CA95|nr:FeoB-associated Cys-rich membrane protein [Ruminococcus sp.]MEE1262155.1 FeoB-associated Cys-rich membrane protein [Ruminococcus sp.]